MDLFSVSMMNRKIHGQVWFNSKRHNSVGDIFEKYSWTAVVIHSKVYKSKQLYVNFHFFLLSHVSHHIFNCNLSFFCRCIKYQYITVDWLCVVMEGMENMVLHSLCSLVLLSCLVISHFPSHQAGPVKLLSEIIPTKILSLKKVSSRETYYI